MFESHIDLWTNIFLSGLLSNYVQSLIFNVSKLHFENELSYKAALKKKFKIIESKLTELANSKLLSSFMYTSLCK